MFFKLYHVTIPDIGLAERKTRIEISIFNKQGNLLTLVHISLEMNWKRIVNMEPDGQMKIHIDKQNQLDMVN